MAENKIALQKFNSTDEMVNFFDANDMGDYLENMPEVEYDIDIKSSKTYFAVESTLSSRIANLARQRGISAETLLNLWVQEKLQETKTLPIYQVAER